MASGSAYFGFTAAGSSGSSTITGAISSPQVAFGSASNTIAGDSTFTFNASGVNKEVTANKFQLNNIALVGTPVAGYLEYNGSGLFFTVGSTRYQIQMA